MHDTPGYHVTLIRTERDRVFLQIDVKCSLQNEKELVFSVMLVPMQLALDNSNPDNGIVDFAERLAVEVLPDRRDDAWDVNNLEKVELGHKIRGILGLLRHG